MNTDKLNEQNRRMRQEFEFYKRNRGRQRNTTAMCRSVLLPGTMLLALLAAGCSGDKSVPPAPPPEVSVVTVQTEKIHLATELPGRTAAFRTADIRPQVNGILQQRLFEEGADVQAGDVLYQIDPAPFEAALKSAQATLAQAEANLGAIQLRTRRYGELIADKAVSQQDYDDAKASMEQTEAQILAGEAAVRTAEINLGYTRITAPITGRIGRSAVTEGALVNAYQAPALATIQQLDPIYVDVPQSSTELLRLRQRLESGQLKKDGEDQRTVQLQLADGTPYPQQGTLQFQEVTVDPSTGSVILRAIFPNPDGVLLPGMFVRAQVVEGVNEQAILVPQQCVIRTSKGEPYALLVDGGGVVQQRMLKLMRAVGNHWLVASGLNPGDRLIAEGFQQVRPGMPVNVVAFEPAEKEPSTLSSGVRMFDAAE